MTTYQQLQQKALGLAFILAPLLLVTGAVVYLLGIERSLDGTTSWVEGIFMAFGMMLMPPVNLELARILGQRAPRLGIYCAATVLGLSFGIIPASHRLLQASLVNAGINESVWQVSSQHMGSAPLLIFMFLGFLTVIILGIGLWRQGALPARSALLLAITPILFIIGQGGDDTIAWWQVNIFYPLACITWLIALAPIGWGYLRGDVENARPQTRTVTAQ